MEDTRVVNEPTVIPTDADIATAPKRAVTNEAPSSDACQEETPYRHAHMLTSSDETENNDSDLSASELYINRELSWLAFNRRVLEEAQDTSHPLLERVKFLSIFSNNLDEFFMIRVSGLREQLESGILETSSDGMTPAEQLVSIRRNLEPMLAEHRQTWLQDLLPQLMEAGIRILPYDKLKKKQRRLLKRYFRDEIFPTLTPLAFDPGHPFPHISNLSLNLAVVVADPEHGERFARLKVPGVFQRLLRIPSEDRADIFEGLPLTDVKADNFVWLEDVIRHNLNDLFPGLNVSAAYPFRVTRDADIEIEEDEAADLLAAIEQGVESRFFGKVVRLEVDQTMPKRIRSILVENLGLQPYQVYTLNGPVGMADLMQLTRVERPDLKDEPYTPSSPPALSGPDSIFATLRRKNVLLFHPYDSFSPVLELLEAAAEDPNVLAIKQTLYRVGKNAPVVKALMKARENGKQVAVLVELKARFDEENNIVWAKALERVGVHVVYGLIGLKTHAKLLMVVRREEDRIVRYLHLSTGNYNANTARVYTDFGLFTADADLGADVSDLFNALTGYSRKYNYRKLLVAPSKMRHEICARIEREIEQHQAHGNGHIIMKMNQLVDKQCIKTLYRASQAGVRIDLQIRGICCLRPGMPNVSENIRVTSLVGRFLEHARAYYFHNGGHEEMLLGSADLMPRNLDRRVEQLLPIEDAFIKETIKKILNIHLQDNVKAREMLADGSYRRVQAGKNEKVIDAQKWMLKHRGFWHQAE
jgi:polyphosphate kinase